MKTSFWAGIGLTAALAAGAIGLARLPGLVHLGPLSVALLLGLAGAAFVPVPDRWRNGFGFAAKMLLRAGIVLLGVRLNLALVWEAGPKILLLDATVIVAGVVGITWLGRRLGLDTTLACLIAVDSSICGASAVAVAAPTLRARDDEMALVIPLCSLLGTTAAVTYTIVQHVHPFSLAHYGLMSGATLHEIAQVMAAVNPVPGAVEIGTVTKLTRVVLLVPVVFVLGAWVARRQPASPGAVASPIAKPWFVLGFLVVGVLNTLLLRQSSIPHETIARADHAMLAMSTLLMAMAMAGMGLQIDFARLRANGLRTLTTAVVGWLGLATLAATEIYVLRF